MKLFNWLVFLVFTFLFMGCQSSVETTYTVNEVIELAQGEEFSYVLALGVPIERGFTIKSQAKNFEVSKITISSIGSAQVLYLYKPSSNFKGINTVVIENCISAGGRECSNIELFKFTFIIK